MKKFMNYAFISLLATSIVLVGCGEDEPEEPAVPESDLIGTWMLTPAAGTLAVGPEDGNYEWWTNSAEDVTTRGCFFDDTWEFTADGNLVINTGGNTWLETWQGVDSEQCGAPVAPHVDGTYTYVHDEAAGTLLLEGQGAFLGLPKATDVGEIGNQIQEAPASRTFNVQTLSSSTLVVRVLAGEAHWQFTFTKQ